MTAYNEKEIRKQIGYTTLFERNKNSKAKVVVNVGGAGSSKSHSIAQLFVYKLINEKGKTFGVLRKTFPALRMTAMGLILSLLKEYGIYREENHNKTANTYTHGDNIIWFLSIDESDKIKSTNFSYIWVEEANETSWEDHIVLKLRLRVPTKPGELNQMFLSLNPSDAAGWIPKNLTGLDNKGLGSDVEVIHSTWEDNPYLDKDYIKVIQDLITQDLNYYNIYALGHWGMLEGRIFTNYKVIPEMPDMSKVKTHWAYGLDFGYSSISTLVKVTLFDDKTYVEEMFYKSKWTNSDIIEFLSHISRGDIYGDPSSKQSIMEIAHAGYMAFEGIKSVKESIDLCKRQTLLIPQSSTNLIQEIQSYHWKKNPQATGAEDAFLPEPVKFRDHAMDAWRYAVWGITSRFGFPTQRPRNSEPIKSLNFQGQERNKLLDRWLKRGN